MVENVNKPKKATEPHYAHIRNRIVPQTRQTKQAIERSSKKIPFNPRKICQIPGKFL
jgi:hypothetical protein